MILLQARVKQINCDLTSDTHPDGHEFYTYTLVLYLLFRFERVCIFNNKFNLSRISVQIVIVVCEYLITS